MKVLPDGQNETQSTKWSRINKPPFSALGGEHRMEDTKKEDEEFFVIINDLGIMEPNRNGRNSN